MHSSSWRFFNVCWCEPCDLHGRCTRESGRALFGSSKNPNKRFELQTDNHKYDGCDGDEDLRAAQSGLKLVQFSAESTAEYWEAAPAAGVEVVVVEVERGCEAFAFPLIAGPECEKAGDPRFELFRTD